MRKFILLNTVVILLIKVLPMAVAQEPSIYTRELLALSKSFPELATDETQLYRYAAKRARERICIDGKLDDTAWQTATKTTSFVDLITGNPTLHQTQGAVLWDSHALYVGFWVTEPNIEAKYEQRDDRIYLENDIEIFIAGRDAYYELELNAKGTIYEALFVWRNRYKPGNYHRVPQLGRSAADSRLFDGVDLNGHPRGKRFAFMRYDLPGLQTAVHLNGSLNDRTDTDQGWTVELALPWTSLSVLSASENATSSPRPGEQLRLNLFRFNKYKTAIPAEDSGGWALSKHGVWDSHIPELYPIVTLTD